MRVCQRTHQGRVRSSNQDCLHVDGCVYGVAVGMGGHQGGETASRRADQIAKSCCSRIRSARFAHIFRPARLTRTNPARRRADATRI